MAVVHKIIYTGDSLSGAAMPISNSLSCFIWALPEILHKSSWLRKSILEVRGNLSRKMYETQKTYLGVYFKVGRTMAENPGRSRPCHHPFIMRVSKIPFSDNQLSFFQLNVSNPSTAAVSWCSGTSNPFT